MVSKTEVRRDGRACGVLAVVRACGVLAVVLALVGLLGGCASDSVPTGPDFALTIWNQSQFDLLEVHVHPVERFTDTENLAGLGLRPGEHLQVDQFPSGSFVTVVRRRVEVGGRIAVSTAIPIELDADGYALVVFDASFRLLEPDSADNPFAIPWATP